MPERLMGCAQAAIIFIAIDTSILLCCLQIESSQNITTTWLSQISSVARNPTALPTIEIMSDLT